MRRVAALLLVLCLALPALASPAGKWQGTIDLPGTKLGIDVDLVEGSSGAWSGDITIPAQGARDLALEKIAVAGTQVTFVISGVPGEPTFKGSLSDDGAKIAGTFTQGGASFPFALTRGQDAVASAASVLEGFDAFVNDAIQAWEVPGVAIAIVKDGKVVYAKGFGTKELGKAAPVTEKTLFAIGSQTKAFTTFTMATLVDEGKLAWDRPVREYLPFFELKDPAISQAITVRDLVTHRSGLPRHDALWYNATDVSRAEMVRRLRDLEFSAGHRERFQYNNLMFLTAGYLIEQVTGKSWEEAVRERVLAPIGMTSSNFSVADSQKAADFSFPHGERNDKLQVIPFRNITNVGPAGSINSNVDELAKWMLVHLGGGKVDGKEILSKATLDELHRPVMATGTLPDRPEMGPASYALGWFVDAYRGHLRNNHGGAIDGFGCLVTLFPNDGLGIAVLENHDYSGLAGVLTQHAADRMLGLPPIDWNQDGLTKLKAAKEQRKQAQEKKGTYRKTGTKPSHPIGEYAGDYAHPGYGEIAIRESKGELSMRYNGITTPLEAWHYDVFKGKRGEDPAWENIPVSFRSDNDGDLFALDIGIEPAVGPQTFRKKPDARLSDPEHLKRFAGTYSLGGQAVTISLKGNVLNLSIPGQPTYTLDPGIGDKFQLRGLTDYSVRFHADAKGNVTGLVVVQPDGVYDAKRQ